MRLNLLLLLLIFCFSTWSYSQCGPGTPTFNVDLTGNPNGSWTSPVVGKSDTCCGSGNPNRCIKFVITLDPAAQGINFDIPQPGCGAKPSGALYYQIGCGPQTPIGQPICLQGPWPQVLTFCKPGGNMNCYQISSIPPATGGTDVTVDKGCSHTLHATGYDSTTVTWNSVFPGALGAYNNYLSCTSGCLNPVASAGAGTPPPYVDYVICGKTVALCNTQTVCDTIRVTFNPSLVVTINPAIPTICFGQTSITLTANASGGTPPYSYLWNNINTAQSINAGAGTYVVSVADASGCPSASASVTVTSYSVAISANAGPDVTVCSQNAVAALNGSVVSASGGIWSGGAGVFSPDNTTLSGVTYTPTPAEIASGCLTLTLTTTGNGTCPPASDAVQICFVGFTGTASVAPVNISCFGGSNGSATATVTGGIGPHSYFWSTGATTTTISGLTLGSYSVTIQNGIGCTTQSVVAISQPTPLAINSTNVNVSCFGGNNGSVSATALGGTPGYTYLWNPGGLTTSSISNLVAGSYSLTVTDNNACQIQSVTAITQPPQLTVVLSPVNTSCFNGSNGSISSTVTGGVAPYSYNWSPVSITSPNATGLAAGSYTLIATDSKGCTRSATVSITQPAVLSVSVAITNESCSYSNNGTASASVSGGTAAYSYSWQPGGQTVSSVSNLAAGNYSLTVTDSKGCNTAAVAAITEPAALAVTFINQTNVSCFGGGNGAVTANTSGGTPGYTYLWNPGGQTSGSASNLTAGSYTFTATDTKGCLVQDVVSITQPALPLTVSATATAVSCGGGSNGMLSASASGGTSAYTYSWQPGSYTGQTVSNITAGTYTVTALDMKGCIAANTVLVNEPSIINLTTSSVNAACSANNGLASVSAAGGSSPYTYSWNPTGQTTSTATGLFAGSYTATVTDDNGCSASATGNVNNNGGPTASISSTTNASCYGGLNGSAVASGINGTLPYTYLWSTTPQQTGSTASGLAAGNYFVTLVDGTGCKSLANVTITEPSQILVTAAIGSHVSCFGGAGGSATASASGGNPAYTFTWLPGGSTGNSISGLTANTYTVQVADASACVNASVFVINQPAPLISAITPFSNVSCFGGSNGSATASVSGGTPFYNYSWTPSGGNGPTVAGLSAGTYTVNIVDSQGCTQSSSVIITQPAQPLAASSASTFVQCFGGTTGTATVTPTGGTSGYTYQWSPSGGTNQTATGLVSGTYDIVVTDANGCQTNTSVLVSQSSVISGVLLSVNPSCGLPNGSISSQISGGTGSYSYVWTPGSFTSAGINGVGPGTYSLLVTDGGGCTATFTATLTNTSGPIGAVSSVNNVSCFGGNNGVATINVTQGTPPYNISWSPYGGNSLSASSLIAGTYTANVTDALGCETSVVAAITQPAAVNISISSVTPVSCFGGSNGAAVVSGSGGTSPYVYSWSNGQTSSAAINLSAGTYTVNVLDNNNCPASTVINITQPSTSLNVSISSVVNSSCFGGTGSATASSAGGTVPYFYSWTTSPVQTGSTATNLPSGTYIVVSTDTKGCTASNTVTINQPAQVITTAGPHYTVCINSPVTFTASASGGSGSYYYLWQPSGLINSGVLTVTPTVSTTYTCIGYDVNGCPGIPDTVSAIVYNLTAANVQLSAYSPICPGQSSAIFVQTTGSTGPLTYVWSPNLGTGPGAYLVTPTQPTTYSVTVSNSCGVSVTNAVQILFNQPPTVFCSADPNSSCLPVVVNFSDSSISSNSADPISSWYWNFGDGTFSTLQNPSHTYTQTGTYVVVLTVSTSGGCTGNNASTPIIITGYPSPTALFTTNPTVTPMTVHTISFINQSSGAVSYLWDFGDGGTASVADPQHYFATLGVYSITLVVTNQYGCKDSFLLKTIGEGDIIFPNAFTPDLNGPNGGAYDPFNLDNNVFFPFAGEVKDFHMQIFNRWGELIFETFDINIGWDGYYRGELCQQEMYVWKADVTFNDGKRVQRTGDITLLR